MIPIQYLARDGNPEDSDPKFDSIIVLSRVPSSLPESPVLSDEEKNKAARFVREGDRTAYAFRHHLLRTLLARWLRTHPDTLHFSVNPFGKPFLEDCPFHFNMSRSGTLLCYYFGPSDGGVDIERRRDPSSYREIAARHFHDEEKTMMREDDDFFIIWTRKESLLKATGTGLSSGLHHFDCSKDIVCAGHHSYHLRSYADAESILSICLPASVPDLQFYKINTKD